jgi:hypothetical protein
MRSQSNCNEIINLLSDDDTPPRGDASNPIVLDSDDEVDPILAERVSSVHPLLDASPSTPRRRNIQPRSPPGSKFLASSPASLRGPPMGVPDTEDEFRDAESPSVQRATLSPHSDIHSVQAVPSPNANVDQMPSPIQDGSGIQDKMPNRVSENLREALSPVAFSPSAMSPKSRNKGIHLLAIARISSSPNRGHDPRVGASADSSFVPVSRGIEKGDAQSKEAPTPMRANSSCNIISPMLVSAAQNMSITTSPTLLRVARRSYPEKSDGPTNTTRDSVSSTPTGEPFR